MHNATQGAERTLTDREKELIDESGKQTHASCLRYLPSHESRVNSSATVGTEPAGIQRYSMDINPLTYARNSAYLKASEYD